jgi:hypothetical protein
MKIQIKEVSLDIPIEEINHLERELVTAMRALHPSAQFQDALFEGFPSLKRLYVVLTSDINN